MPEPKWTLYINGKEIIINSAKFLRTMDTGADALNINTPWEPGKDSEIDEAIRAYGYQDTELYINDELQMMGRLYNVSPKFSGAGISKDLEIFSKTADIIDSTVVYPYEANNIGLLARCKQQCEKFGINVLVDAGVELYKWQSIPVERYVRIKEKELSFDADKTFLNTLQKTAFDEGQNIIKKYNADVEVFEAVQGRKMVYQEIKFPRVSAKQTDKIFDHLKKLAIQRGYLLSCTIRGDLLITKAQIDSTPVGTIRVETGISDQYLAKFNGRNRFKFYKAIASSSRSNRARKSGKATDTAVPINRFLTFSAGDSIPGQAKNAAEWRKNKVAADSMPLSFPVNTIFDQNGKIWKPNTTITVVSPELEIKNGFTFLINQVELDYVASGSKGVLKLKPPSVYTTGAIKEPWLE
jgi:prophage tail gpP-like protein